MSKYLTPDKVFSLLFVDNNEDSSTSDRYLVDDDCSDFVPSDNDNEEDIILSDPEYDSEDNNDDNVAARDVNDKNITNTTTALFKSKSGTESRAAKLLLHLTFKTSQRNIMRSLDQQYMPSGRVVHLEIAFVCFSEIIFLNKYVNGLIKKIEVYF